jgi:hypothetical protein
MDEEIELGKKAAIRLGKELEWAQTSWASFEAINGRQNDATKRIYDAKNYLLCSGHDAFLKNLFWRATLLSLFRITDQHQNDIQNLSTVQHVLRIDRCAKRVCEKGWFVSLNCPEFLLDSEIAAQPLRIKTILQLVPQRWSNTKPDKPALHELRTKLRILRDSSLAHLLETTPAQTFPNQIRAFLRISECLVYRSQLIFCGSAVEPRGAFGQSMKAANDYFGHANDGFLMGYEEDNARRLAAGCEPWAPT